MIADRDFVPRWASPPGETLEDVMRDRALDRRQLASLLELSSDNLEALLAGRLAVTVGLARRLAKYVGGTVEFWLTRDAEYQEDRHRVAADEWAVGLPTAQMVKLGWIRRPDDWKERISICLNFFNVRDAMEWRSKYHPVLEAAHFRSSPSARRDSFAILAWLRQGEIKVVQPGSAWNSDRFQAALQWLRPLTRQKDPAIFLPELTATCAEAGVGVGVLQAPTGCPISGVTRFMEGGFPAILLSARHLTDDHFWFTFFHEAGHLLLHGASEVFLDTDVELSNAADLPDQEREANAFAEEVLFPGGLNDLSAARRQPDTRRIIRKAHELRVSPGLLVGQLQHRGVIGYDSLNGLKRRYRWNGANLEMA